MKEIRQAVQQIQYSVRDISERAASRDDVVRLDIGQPDFDSPDAAKQAAKDAIDRGRITYTSLWGIDELREEIASFESHKADYSHDNIMATTGGIGALYCIFSTLCEPGENIVFNDPCWSVYPMLANASTAELRQVPYFDGGEVDVEAVEQAVDEDTKALVVNSPENPTGRVYTRDEIEQLAGIAERNDLYLIGDEVYDRLTYGKDHVSVAEVAPERSLIVNSMSKNFAMTGWRLGWVAADDPDLIHELGKVNRATTACPNFAAQHAALGALRNSMDYVDEMRQEYAERKALIEDELDRLGLDYVEPEGAIYIFPDVGRDSWEFAHDLLDEAGVSVVPGAPSGSDSSTNVRICFGSVGQDAIRDGMQRLADYLA
ncbi:MAG: aminotransferase class I/II-fold pyridoxal phosphate-dependent enzyme [Candidatus Nanohaloarchaea archaeon]|nr:aminotransferase class I/II-fold pyridoxal phosphate-dependent enzyme [Candidatus Nanohaloarchaea archaeon]